MEQISRKGLRIFASTLKGLGQSYAQRSSRRARMLCAAVAVLVGRSRKRQRGGRLPKPQGESRPGAASGVAPGRGSLLDAHNAYPYNGRYLDRIDRALATGLPVAIEQDLVATGRRGPSGAVDRVTRGAV